jgi:hypothetical protein
MINRSVVHMLLGVAVECYFSGNRKFNLLSLVDED